MGGKKEGKICAIRRVQRRKKSTKEIDMEFYTLDGKGKDDEENGEEQTEEK